MAWISAAAVLEDYVNDNRQCDNCNSTNINLISGSELTCLTCGQITSNAIDSHLDEYSLQLVKDNGLRPILFDKSKLSLEWKKVCNQLNISDDSFLRKMLHERRRARRKIANNRQYFLLLIGSLYYIQKRNSGASIFLDDIVNRLGLSTVTKKFAKVISEVSLQLNVKIHSQSLQSLISNLINQLISNRYSEYVKIVNNDTFSPKSFLTQLICNKTLTLENKVAINSTTFSNFISEHNKLIVDNTVDILHRFQMLDTNLQFVDDIFASEWRKYGCLSKITLAIAIHIALYKLSIPLPVKEYVTLLAINRSSFYRRRSYIQKLIGAEDPVIPIKYFGINTIKSDDDIMISDNTTGIDRQKKKCAEKYAQLQKEINSKHLNMDRQCITVTNDKRSKCIVCRYRSNGKIKKRCFSFNRYGIEGAKKLAEVFKLSHTNCSNHGTL
ncbi:hypothetical protein BMR1_03g03745 [Babesia microti strain RI]|uniref:Uncharacterized protein n=1 Tax=Babesia microti (strain RI) TaxID=1133968 RepID=A0A0K3ANQ5_BABMR|nr:hypothetical protein BMR1_03g03745 [Babesia microti strain RI]CTQ41349.1 hypothetical protein BMR1_03g03745 [Babesia microti strain RI]|eukprot:XP_012649360.1 hypothetical protein BMR1_03g03745 [Babesia microti strain RI]